MSEAPAPAGGKRKRPVVQHVTNKYNITNNITNNYDHSVTNNDNRVTNNTYNVRTTDKKPPRHWVDEKTKLPKTNVANVSWHKRDSKWEVRAVDAETRKLRAVGARAEWEDAVRLREEPSAEVRLSSTFGGSGQPARACFPETCRSDRRSECRSGFKSGPRSRT